MKKRETKSVREDAGRRTALVRAGSRWLSFARTLARGRSRLAVSNTLSFIESLYGEKFRTVEGGAFSLNKVYRMVGGGLSVSKARLSFSMHPRFDLRLRNITEVHAASQVFREAATTTTTTIRTLLSRTVAGGREREQAQAVRHNTNVDARSFKSHSNALYQTIAPVAFTLLQRRAHFGGLHQQRTHFVGPQTTTTLINAVSTHGISVQLSQGVAASSSQGVAAPSSKAHTWNLLTTGVERLRPAFGYVFVRGQGAQQTQALESARQLLFGERMVRGDVTTGTSVETPRPSDVPSPVSLRLTSLDLRRTLIHAPRQEFVSVLLKTHLPAVESRESLNVPTTRDLSGAAPTWATAQGETGRRFALTHGVAERSSTMRTYAVPTTRQQPGGAVEIRREFREFRSVETVREHATAPPATAPHASARESQPPLLHLLSPTSLLLSLSEDFLLSWSEDFLSVSVAGARVQGGTTYHLGGRAPALSLRHVHTRTAPSVTREGSVAAHAPRLLAQTPQHRTTLRPTVTREVLASIHTFVGRMHTTFAGPQAQAGIMQADVTQSGITQVGYSTVFTRPGFESVLRRSFEHVSARQRGTLNGAAPGHTTTRSLFGRAVEFVRPASAVELTHDASTHNASTWVTHERAPGAFSAHYISTPGAGTFLFATGLLRRAAGASTAGAATAGGLSPTAATAMRLAAVAETERVARETRAARPEGMALELIRQRREGVLQLPQPGYVFTQPARAQLEERQVITKASREEIVEVVRKEVRTLAASAPATAAASRPDLAGLADEVYSTLVRRLMVEKERLGRF